MGGKLGKVRRGAKGRPYDERDYEQKVETQWRKARGLFARGEYSMAILRAASMVELSLNYVLEQELRVRGAVSAEAFEKVLRFCNGPKGKFALCKSLEQGRPKLKKALTAHRKDHTTLYEQRNGIVHSGKFARKSTAQERLSSACVMALRFIRVYDGSFGLAELDPEEVKEARRS